MPDANGIYIGRNEKNNIRLTAVKDEETVVFHLQPETAQTLVSSLQSELAGVRSGGQQ